MDEWIATLDDDALEFFNERAGIAEFEAGMSRAEAEAFAKTLTENYLRRRDQK